MEVILMEEIPELGKIGDVVKVKDGYARNFLIPTNKAIRATTRNLKKLEHEKQLAQHRVQKVRLSAEALKEKIEGMVCQVKKAAGETGKLFGSVTNMDLEAYLKEHGVDVEKRQIHLEEPIKSVGSFQVPIRLADGVTATLKVEVEAEEK
ncbi:MAG: 50S ribosomal protein L9 [Deltaproteobacteria bacterium]|nr:MAG: 50S ribosomal protein L9 [Deltaproteobacteria bacterium]